jgi:hypothetical protein
LLLCHLRSAGQLKRVIVIVITNQDSTSSRSAATAADDDARFAPDDDIAPDDGSTHMMKEASSLTGCYRTVVADSCNLTLAHATCASAGSGDSVLAQQSPSAYLHA